MEKLNVEATLDNLAAVTDFVNEQLELAGCPPKAIMQIDLAVEEIYINIASYAYRPETGPATVCCETGEDPLQITIGFIDEGAPYNPLEQEEPDVTADVEDRPIGGLGVFLVKKLTDGISYEFRDGKNILTIYKKICV